MRATLILVFTLVVSASGICAAFTPKDHYLLYCGPSSNSAVDSVFDGRAWSHDENYTFSPPSSFSSTVTALADQDLGSPFTGARIFTSNFTYSFPVSPGPKFLRLFFYPAHYSEYDASHFFFSVQANGHLLLRNFSAQLAVSYAPFTLSQNITSIQFVIKEYYVVVGSSKTSLNLIFSLTPTSGYAFVNGIEVVSVPDNLYGTDNSTIESDSYPIQIQKSYAMETLYRLNVGGGEEVDGQISGMNRLWKNDDPYIFTVPGTTEFTAFPINYTKQVPNYTAPEHVYQTERHLGYDYITNMKLNLTWRFKVDPEFFYMVRLHWCEVAYQVNTWTDRIFEVYINNQEVETYANVMDWANNQRYTPVYRDYVVRVTGGDGSGGSSDLWIVLRPSTQFAGLTSYNEVLLNGVEIFKVNKLYDGSLYAPNPHYVSLDKTLPQQRQVIEPPKRSHLLVAIIGGLVVGLLLITLLACLLLFRRWKTMKESSTNETATRKPSWFLLCFQLVSNTVTSKSGSNLPAHLCRQFSLAQIRLATIDFNEGLIIGRGGFGNVYKGMLDGEKGPFTVAIKRSNPSSKQGVREFMTEIALLSNVRHPHLVSLIGYCDESGEMILVYEYMERGTLRDHLYNTVNPPMSWIQRRNACVGAAKGLHYLHTGGSHMVIHRDVKSTNILLDEKWVSKVSDFGISRLGPLGEDLSHVSTMVKGSFGYFDPEYYRSQRLTDKSDVYSFGVVMFEALCGRPAFDPILTKECVNLALWAKTYQRKGQLDVIVDHNIKGEIAPACLIKFGEIAERCVRKHGVERPSMADVVMSLELALQLQQQATTMSSEILSHHELPLSVTESTMDELQPPTSATFASTSQGEDQTSSSNAC